MSDDSRECEGVKREVKAMDVTRELDLARNAMHQPITDKARELILACLLNPTQETWTAAHRVVIHTKGFVSLLKAVQAIRPGFPGERQHGEPWPQVPDQRTIIAALEYATH